ncbi:MAG: cobalt-precorrin-5B (C(1))-methyltransferase CbiD, partial [Planctomycetota bacterium]
MTPHKPPAEPPAKPLRTGYTTGACAAAAAQAAATLHEGGEVPDHVELVLEGGGGLSIPVESVCREEACVRAVVVKDSGDDPDITNGMRVEVSLTAIATGIEFVAGPGVGTVTRPGLQVSVGEPAINPGPRRMIEAAIRSVSEAGFRVTVSIPGGEAAAAKTFNPRLGIAGGLSVLGTTGVLRPYSHEALRDALVCALDVAEAAGYRRLALVPGNIGRRAAESGYGLPPEQVVEVSNEWG